jgi:hypothetical protein
MKPKPRIVPGKKDAPHKKNDDNDEENKGNFVQKTLEKEN